MPVDEGPIRARIRVVGSRRTDDRVHADSQKEGTARRRDDDGAVVRRGAELQDRVQAGRLAETLDILGQEATMMGISVTKKLNIIIIVGRPMRGGPSLSLMCSHGAGDRLGILIEVRVL